MIPFQTVPQNEPPAVCALQAVGGSFIRLVCISPPQRAFFGSGMENLLFSPSLALAADPFQQLDHRQGRKCVQIHRPQLGRIQGLHLKHMVHSRNRQHQGDQHRPQGKGTQQPLVAQEAFGKQDGMIGFAVKAVEQPGKAQGAKGAGATQQRAALAIACQESQHGHHADHQTLQADFSQEILCQNRPIGSSGGLAHYFIGVGLCAQGDGRKAVGQKVDEQQMHRGKGHRKSCHRCTKDGENGTKVS